VRGDDVNWSGRTAEALSGPPEGEPGGLHAFPVAPLDRWIQAGLWLLLVAFSLHGVFGHSLWGGSDSREGAMIRDMYRHGTWVAPTINGTPFLEKPPLLHWTGLALCHIAGRVNEGLVRLPAALYGLGTLVLVYLFVVGARAPEEPAPATASRQLAAWAAVFTCGTAIEFNDYSRVVVTDTALTFMVTLSLFMFWRAWLRPGVVRWLVFLVAAAAAFYAKGLIGPALIWTAVGIFLLWKRRFRLLAGLAAAYVPLLLVLVLPWVFALYRFAGVAAVKFAFWDNQVGRFFRFGDPTLPHDPYFVHREPLYHYMVHLPPYLAPWTLLLVPTFVAWWRRSSPFREQLHVFITCAMGGMFLVLHASASKVVSYALPTYPLLFMMLGIWLVHSASHPYMAALERWCLGLTAWGVGTVFTSVAVAFAVGTFVRPDLLGVESMTSRIGSLVLAAGLIAFVVVGGRALRRLARSGGRVLAYGLAPAAVAVAAMGVLQIVTSAIDRSRSWKPMAMLAAEEASCGSAVAFAGDIQADLGAFTFYLDRRLPVLPSAADVASYLRAPDPRAVIIPVEKLRSMDAALAAAPHSELAAGAPGTLSRSFVLLVNRPANEAKAGESRRSRFAEH
jgi:4-amino-4-deoxy-L-arabinose transferase-like glycosyltransferase